MRDRWQSKPLLPPQTDARNRQRHHQPGHAITDRKTNEYAAAAAAATAAAAAAAAAATTTTRSSHLSLTPVPRSSRSSNSFAADSIRDTACSAYSLAGLASWGERGDSYTQKIHGKIAGIFRALGARPHQRCQPDRSPGWRSGRTLASMLNNDGVVAVFAPTEGATKLVHRRYDATRALSCLGAKHSSSSRGEARSRLVFQPPKERTRCTRRPQPVGNVDTKNRLPRAEVLQYCTPAPLREGDDDTREQPLLLLQSLYSFSQPFCQAATTGSGRSPTLTASQYSSCAASAAASRRSLSSSNMPAAIVPDLD